MLNMKKIYAILAIASLGLGAAGCSLDVESLNTIDSHTYYKTMNDARAALIGCYDGYRRTVASSPTITFFEASEVMGDDCFGACGSSDVNRMVLDRFDQSLSPSDLNIFENLWQYYYTAIFDCNSFLAQTGNIEWAVDADFNCTTPEETRSAFEAEARFLRAVCYFDLVRLFERVPLLTEPSSEIIPQSEPDEIYDQIFEDLKFAMANIKYVPTHEWYLKNDGRATAEAAGAILARAYLFYSGYYGKDSAECTKTEATEALEKIVSGGNFGLVPAATDAAGVTQDGFTRLWRAACATDAGVNEGLDSHNYVGRACENDGVNEYLFTMKFNYTSDYDGNVTGNRFLVMMGLRGVTDVTSVPYGKGWGSCTVNPKSLAIFSDSDPRLDATVIDYEKEGRAACLTDDVLADWRDFTGYNLKKYIPLSYNVNGAAVPETQAESTNWGSYNGFMEPQYQDYVIMRYADVLLMLSELKGDASYMNLVRARAGQGELAFSEENVLAERHREFMGEGVRYWDLLRQGTDYAAAAIAGSWTVKNMGDEATLTISKDNIVSKRGLCRIPDNQIVASGNVYSQNKGW